MDARIDDGQKVITIAHPEHSSGELKILNVTLTRCCMQHMIVLWGTHLSNNFKIPTCIIKYKPDKNYYHRVIQATYMVQI